MRRRTMLLCCGALAGAGLFTALVPTASRALRNPCRGALPDALAEHPLVRTAFEGLDASRLVDTHAHLLGTGDSGSGCSVHPNTATNPIEIVRKHAILNASCADGEVPSVDRAYVERLVSLAEGFPAGSRWWLFAFDHAHDDRGTPRPDWSTFHVPDAYARQIAQAHAGRFRWVASIHPYRDDALQRLDAAARDGASAIKWLPSTMNIDPTDGRCRPFYERLVRHGLPLVVHCGEEQAAPGAKRHELNNPLLLRRPLAAGVTVIAAHCASLGMARDTDRAHQPDVPAFDLFARVMDEADARQRLLADLSAVFQRNRRDAVWHRLFEREDWHGRLLHGSDYPLPGLVPLVSLKRLHSAGLLEESAAEPLVALRQHNPLLFDFTLKRALRHRGTALPASIFEARALAAAPSSS